MIDERYMMDKNDTVTYAEFSKNYSNIIKEHSTIKIRNMWPATSADIEYKLVSNQNELHDELVRLNKKVFEG